MVTFLAVVATSLWIASEGHCASVKLAWNAVSSSKVIGYKIYAGTSTRSYTKSVTLGKVTSGTVTGLTAGRKYYFAVTSYGANNLQSAYSAEISYTVPSPNQAPVANNMIVKTVEDTRVWRRLKVTDADGDTLTYRIVRNGSLGTAVITNQALGIVRYTPKPGKTGTDTFAYRANDGKVDSNTATVTVTIIPPTTGYEVSQEGVQRSPMSLGTTSGGFQYVLIPTSQGSISDPLGEGGAVDLSFHIETPGTYMMWAQEASPDTSRDSLLISVDSGEFIVWNTALSRTWAWDRLRDGDAAGPVRFWLSAGDHRLTIKQREDAASIRRIMITNSEMPFPATVYALPALGTPGVWSITDPLPAGATIDTVADNDRGGSVTELSGSGTQNEFHLESEDSADWHNGTQYTLEWAMKFSADYVISVALETTAGSRRIEYRPLEANDLGAGEEIGYGLGAGTMAGRWETVIRDLQEDLARAQPGNRILQVNGFSVRGSGRIDNVELRKEH